MGHKIVIATPVDFSNFGNRLQNYAVHKICEDMGLEPVTLAVEYAHTMKVIPKHCILQAIEKLKLGRLFASVSKLKRLNKSVRAWQFTRDEIKTEYVKNQKELNKALNDAAYFGIGGDQVLAPYWRNIIWFATFSEMREDRKICFAPSFGSDRLPESYLKSVIIPEMEKVQHLAVREQSGCEMIKEHLDREALRICDPVVMLTKKDWQHIAERYPVKAEQPFVLLYFLGEIKDSYREHIEKKAREHGCRIIDVSRGSLSDEAACNPMEFVSYLNAAKTVFTDSFHAVMLSLILNNNVVIFERVGGEKMNTRILELIKRYRLSNCVFSESCSKDGATESGCYDKDYVNSVLESERSMANEYYQKFRPDCVL